jgi:hypothetical protein
MYGIAFGNVLQLSIDVMTVDMTAREILTRSAFP